MPAMISMIVEVLACDDTVTMPCASDTADSDPSVSAISGAIGWSGRYKAMFLTFALSGYLVAHPRRICVLVPLTGACLDRSIA